MKFATSVQIVGLLIATTKVMPAFCQSNDQIASQVFQIILLEDDANPGNAILQTELLYPVNLTASNFSLSHPIVEHNTTFSNTLS